MFYVSKITPFFFLLSLFDLFFVIFSKVLGEGYINYGLLAVFGFIASTIVGAMYQIIPNSQQEKLPYPFVSIIVFFLYVIVSISLLINEHKIASIFFFISTVCFTVHITTIIRNIRPITVRFLIASVFYMVLASILFLASSFTKIPVQAAIHAFTVGSMINAVLGVQFAWIPMFYMQQVDFKKGNMLFFLAQISTLAILVSFALFDYRLIFASLIFEIGVIIFYTTIVFPIVKSGKSLIGIPYVVKFFITGLSFLLAGLFIALVITLTRNGLLIAYHIDFMIFGFGVFTILGGILHLTPRIIWNMVYVEKAQKGKSIPQVNKVIPAEKADLFFKLLFISFLIAIISEGVSFVYGWLLFLFVLSVFSFYFGYNLYRLYRL